jgi:hypothetical protein
MTTMATRKNTTDELLLRAITLLEGINDRLEELAGTQQDTTVNTRQAARLLGKSVAAVRQAVYRGDLPATKRGRTLRFSKKLLQSLM